MNLFGQFRRVANVYFLLIAILQLIPGLSTLNPVTSILPLVFVIVVTMIKDLLEDLRRHSSDCKANSKMSLVWQGEEFVQTQWKDIRVGDFVKVECDDLVPADIVILYSPLDNGACNIETTNLDGETNLKTKQAIQVNGTGLDLEQGPKGLKGKMLCDHPNPHLYVFGGSLSLDGTNNIPIDNSNVILRSCSLRNTAFVIGFVVYTGHETKIMKNSGKSPIKQTKLEKLLNVFVYIAFAFQILFCLFCAIMCGIFYLRVKDHWYLKAAEENAGAKGAISFLTHIILYNTLIPISLYVTLEVVKLGQVLFINNDRRMYDPKSDTRANARTSNLNESLGMIEYVFSDKTGTLTQNVMEFFKCSIGGKMYGKGISEIKAAEMRRNGIKDAKPTGRGFEDDSLMAILNKEDSGRSEGLSSNANQDGEKGKGNISERDKDRNNIISFFTNLSVCHTCLAEIPKGKRPAGSGTPTSEEIIMYPGKLVYKAASPDEGALVDAAANIGFEFRGCEKRNYVVRMKADAAMELYKGGTTPLPTPDENGKVDVRIEVLYVLEFNSDRKRNSEIVRLPNGKVRVYSKGADATMIPLLSKEKTDDAVLQATLDHMREYASEGLRTLVLAKRDIESEEEFEKWEKKYQEALNSIEDRQKRVDEVAAEIEIDLELIGATAIEDKLQEGVPDCIEVLRKAGIKVWVLTGDKQETAINIGFACKLLTQEMQMMVISGKDTQLIKKQINELAHVFATIPASHFMNYALVIEGSALTYCLSDEVISETLSVCMKCGVVICCRVSPKQKADVVGAIRDNSDSTTLSIGDGANDVPMIQRAHVGVGISGNEGMQAVMSSDYSFAQFRFLQRLLLVHGRMSYKRLSMVVLYSFYKNFAFTLTMFWNDWFNGFSGQSQYESWFISFFNLIFTVAPIVVYGLGDAELRPNRMAKLPATYALGRLGREATPATFVRWILDGLWCSFVNFYVGMFMFETLIQSDGKAEDIWFMGNAIITATIITVTVRLFLEFNLVTWIHWLIVILSVLSWFLVAIIFNAGLQPSLTGSFWRNFMSLTYWMYIIVSPIICLIPPYAIRWIKRQFKPSVDNVIRERELITRQSIMNKMKRLQNAKGIKQPAGLEDSLNVPLTKRLGGEEDDWEIDDIETEFMKDVGFNIAESAAPEPFNSSSLEEENRTNENQTKDSSSSSSSSSSAKSSAETSASSALSMQPYENRSRLSRRMTLRTGYAYTFTEDLINTEEKYAARAKMNESTYSASASASSSSSSSSSSNYLSA
eukprot:MONOS_4849.1-p1 / transcript=MONOS_4849.1 / gene=MONOS_4849 / organism=Monocercomonoides_exilis_PA203 / gene_product=P-type ATPase / transcript_product=P-type ATPase / location=Mono_scaffold00135:41891-45700(-) / protein_length=1269 / sequence_SO=supercontig / SO=protein_coding / is_pseudo=false